MKRPQARVLGGVLALATAIAVAVGGSRLLVDDLTAAAPCEADVRWLPACLADRAEEAARTGNFGEPHGRPDRLALAGKVATAREAVDAMPPDEFPDLAAKSVTIAEIGLAAQADPNTPASLAALERPLRGTILVMQLLGAHPFFTSQNRDLREGLAEDWPRHPRPGTATLRAVLAQWERDIPSLPEARLATERLALGTWLAAAGDPAAARLLLPGIDTVEDYELNCHAMTWLAAESPALARRLVRQLAPERQAAPLARLAQAFLDQADPSAARTAVAEAYAAADAAAELSDPDPTSRLPLTRRWARFRAYVDLVPIQLRLGDLSEARRRAAMLPVMPVPPGAEVQAADTLSLTGLPEAAIATLERDLPYAQGLTDDAGSGRQRSHMLAKFGAALYASHAEPRGLQLLTPLEPGFRQHAGERIVVAHLDCTHAPETVRTVATELHLASSLRLRLAAAARCARTGNAAAASLVTDALADPDPAPADLWDLAVAAHLADHPDLVATTLRLAAIRSTQDHDRPRRARTLAETAAWAAELLPPPPQIEPR